MKQLYLRITLAILLLFSFGRASAQLTAACTPSYPNGTGSWYTTSWSINTTVPFSHSPSSSTHDYTATQSFDVTAGATYAITATTIGYVSLGIAVDFNNNGVLNDPGEILMPQATYIATSPATYNFNITIPPTALTGSYRFRIWNIGANAGAGSPAGSPCGTYGYGNWVDYTVNVVNTATCQPSSALSVTNIQPTTADISWAAPTTSTPVGYLWKVVNQGDDPSLVAGVATGYITGLSTTATGLTSATNYQLYVKSDCGSNDSSLWTLPYAFSTPCSGIPNASTATGPASVCAGISFNLVATGMTVATGITYQWQAYNPITSLWDSIGNTSTFAVTAGITTATDYRFVTTCVNGGAQDISNTLSITINAPNTCYCIPAGTNSSHYINNFSTTGGIQDISNLGSGFSTGGYGDFTSMDTVSILPGNSFTVNAAYGSGSNTFGTKIWIDFDGDGNFTTAGDQVYGSSSYVNTLSTSISIPITATPITTRMRIGISWTPNTGPATPCSSINGEFEDYTIKIMPLIACSGTPAVATASGPAGVCANASFTLTATGYTTGSGLTYQWQAYNPITSLWDSIGNTPTFVVSAGITTATDYRFVTTCTNGGGQDISNTVSETINQFYSCYCTPVSNCTNEGIDSVSFDALSHTSAYCASGGYSNYDNLGSLASVQQAQVVAMAVKAHINSNPASAGVWIDYDHSGTFDAGEYTAFPNAVGVTPLPSEYIFSGNVTIPVTAMTGITRMRVRSANQGGITSTSACNTGTVYGEYEDYLITINAGSGCTGTPTAGTASGPTDVCSSIDFILNATGFTNGATGLTYQWQVYNTVTSMWDSIGNTPSLTVVGGQTVASDYRFVVTCVNGGGQDISNTVSVGMSSFLVCYCTPGTTTPIYGDDILNVTFAGINNSTGVGNSNGYNDYTSSVAAAQVLPGVSYPISMIIDAGGNEYGGVWIDWDQNGVFDASEYTYMGNGQTPTVLSQTIMVPSTAVPGLTRMRVRSKYGSTLAATDACAGYSDGETEDYYVSIGLPPSCIPPGSLNVTNLLATTATLNWVEQGTATQWTVEYGPQGFTPGTGTFAVVNTTPTLNLTNLTATTSYDFYVRAICSATDSSIQSGPVTFTTACATFIAPFTESFNTSSLPNCWSNTGTGDLWQFSSGSGPAYGVAGSTDHTGNGGDFAWVDGSSPNGTGITLLSPVIDISTLTSARLRYYVKSFNSDDAQNNKLIVSALDGSTWVQIDSIQFNFPTNGWNERIFSLSGITSTTTQLKFVVDELNTVGSSFYNDILIDDVNVENTPSCIAPTGLASTSSTLTSADVTWNTVSGAAGYEYAVDQTNTLAPGGSTTVLTTATNTPPTVTGLLANSNYYLHVRTDCGVTNGYSTWVVLAFNTPIINDTCGGAIAIPWTGTISGNNTNATDDILPSVSCGSTAANYKGLWYTVTPAASGSLTISMCSGPANWDSYMRVYEGTCGNFTACAGYNDDFCGTTSEVTIASAVANTTYYVLVTGYSASYYGPFTLTTSGVPLAIKLTDISATNVGTRNRVDWSTGSEDHGDYFIVERSADGRNFTAMGNVTAKGSASTYSYWDENPYGGMNYYRLKMMDASGKANYSKVVTAILKGNGAFTVEAFPNPVSNDLTVQVYGNAGSNAMVTITDVTGKVVKVVTVDNNKATISMSELAAGMYLVKYTDSNHSQILKVNKK